MWQNQSTAQIQWIGRIFLMGINWCFKIVRNWNQLASFLNIGQWNQVEQNPRNPVPETPTEVLGLLQILQNQTQQTFLRILRVETRQNIVVSLKENEPKISV